MVGSTRKMDHQGAPPVQFSLLAWEPIPRLQDFISKTWPLEKGPGVLEYGGQKSETGSALHLFSRQFLNMVFPFADKRT